MKIFITGGAGFIGYYVARRFLQNGCEVVLFDNLSTGKQENIDDLKNEFGEKMTFVKGDIRNIDELREAMLDSEFVVHLASVVSVPLSIQKPQETNEIIVGGTINVFEMMKKLDINNIVMASSSAVYGNVKKFPISEDKLDKQLSPYAISKLMTEHYGNMYANLFGINAVALRFFNIFGSRQDASSEYSGVISKFVKVFKEGGEINIYGDGKNVRDFLYVEDLAECIFQIHKKRFSGFSVYNLGSGKATTILGLVKALEKVFKKKAKVNFLPERVGDIKKSFADISKIRKAFRFRPKYSLQTVLKGIVK